MVSTNCDLHQAYTSNCSFNIGTILLKKRRALCPSMRTLARTTLHACRVLICDGDAPTQHSTHTHTRAHAHIISYARLLFNSTQCVVLIVSVQMHSARSPIGRRTLLLTQTPLKFLISNVFLYE